MSEVKRRANATLELKQLHDAWFTEILVPEEIIALRQYYELAVTRKDVKAVLVGCDSEDDAERRNHFVGELLKIGGWTVEEAAPKLNKAYAQRLFDGLEPPLKEKLDETTTELRDTFRAQMRKILVTDLFYDRKVVSKGTIDESDVDDTYYGLRMMNYMGIPLFAVFCFILAFIEIYVVGYLLPLPEDSGWDESNCGTPENCRWEFTVYGLFPMWWMLWASIYLPWCIYLCMENWKWATGSTFFDQFRIIDTPRHFDIERENVSYSLWDFCTNYQLKQILVVRFFGAHTYQNVFPDFTKVSKLSWVCQVLFCFYLPTFGYGYYHYVVHMIEKYREVHAVHHLIRRTSILGGEALGPTDENYELVIWHLPLVILYYLDILEFWPGFMGICSLQLFTRVIHSNYEFGMFGPFNYLPLLWHHASHHSLHHVYPNKNFHDVPILDYYMGTYMEIDDYYKASRAKSKYSWKAKKEVGEEGKKSSTTSA